MNSRGFMSVALVVALVAIVLLGGYIYWQTYLSPVAPTGVVILTPTSTENVATGTILQNPITATTTVGTTSTLPFHCPPNAMCMPAITH